MSAPSRKPRVAVVGGGSWGTTVASLTARNAPTVLWARRPEVAEEIERDHVNSGYLHGESLHPELRATSSLEEAVAQADVLVMAVPSHGFRAVLEQAAPHVRPWVPIVSLTKGLEQETHKPDDRGDRGHPARPPGGRARRPEPGAKRCLRATPRRR